MKPENLTYKIYSNEILGDASGFKVEPTETDIREVASIYEIALEKAFKEAGYEIEIEIVHNTSGAGSGLGGYFDDHDEIRITEIAGRIWEATIEAWGIEYDARPDVFLDEVRRGWVDTVKSNGAPYLASTVIVVDKDDREEYIGDPYKFGVQTAVDHLNRVRRNIVT